MRYREAVAHSIRRQSDRLRYTTGAQVRVICIDLDKLVTNILEQDIRQSKAPEWRKNNFYIYEVIYLLSQDRAMFQYQLDKRRTFLCPSCTNITKQILEGLNSD